MLLSIPLSSAFLGLLVGLELLLHRMPVTFGMIGSDDVIPKSPQYGYMAQVNSYDPDTHLLRKTCGGTILSKDFVLTAAHCFFPSGVEKPAFKAMVSVGSRYNQLLMLPGRIEKMGHATLHPEYNRRGLHHDVAVIKLNESLDMSNSFINTIALAKKEDSYYPETCFVMGWGANATWPYTEILQIAMMPILPDDVCQKMSKTFDRKRSLCVGIEDRGSPNICKGDSGGPVVCLAHVDQNVGPVAQFGISSFTKGPCDPKDFRPIFMPRISFYREWIEGIITPK